MPVAFSGSTHIASFEGAGTPTSIAVSEGPRITTRGARPATRGKPKQAASAEEPEAFRALPAFLPIRNHAGGPPKRSIAEMTGSGVCVLDYDGDGRPDLYFPDGGDAGAVLAGPESSGRAPPIRNRLFRNLGGLRFADVSELAGVDDPGYAGGCAAGDVDNDGDPDLLVANLGPNVFYENRGDGTFRRRRDAGVEHDGFGTGAAFADLDGDGWLDAYVCNYVDRRLADLGSRCRYFGMEVFCGPNGLPGEADVLYRNLAGAGFEDATEKAGVHAPDTRGFSVLLTDLDGDRRPDIRVANDATRDLVFRNLGGMRFADESLLSGAAYSGSGMEQSGMGSAAGDFDGDGARDLFVTNFQRDYNTMFRNQTERGGRLRFEDATAAAGLSLSALPFLGWAALPIDLEHDGDLDLFVANGHIYPALRERPEIGEPYEQANQLFMNDGSGSFRSGTAPGPLRSSRGAARVDLDGDGDDDIVVTNLDQPPDLLIAETTAPSARLRLIGVSGNRDGMNAVVEVAPADGGAAIVRELRGSDGYLGSNELTVNLGLGSARAFPEVRILWPSGRETRLRNVGPGSHVVKESVGVLR